MYTTQDIKNILSHFCVEGDLVSWENIDDGHINDTIKLTVQNNGKASYRLLQRINTNVFRRPDLLMDNVARVTAVIKAKVMQEGGDSERETLYCIPTKDGKNYITDEKYGTWRVYNFVTDSISFNSIVKPGVFFDTGAAFGKFQNQLADFPIETLNETIPDFHDTEKRYTAFLESVENDPVSRVHDALDEIYALKQRADDTHFLTDKIKSGELPLRVTHNDTKLNNILFDRDTLKPVCVVDLDTVMPGLSLYDFGDAIRYGANTAAEDEPDTSKISLDMDLYNEYLNGYLSTAGETLTDKEKELLPWGARMMTLELVIRFLKDYIDGDVYFKTDYPEHNLVRARAQLALLKDMEKKLF